MAIILSVIALGVVIGFVRVTAKRIHAIESWVASLRLACADYDDYGE